MPDLCDPWRGRPYILNPGTGAIGALNHLGPKRGVAIFRPKSLVPRQNSIRFVGFNRSQDLGPHFLSGLKRFVLRSLQWWGEKRRKELLRNVVGDLLVLPISDPRIHQRWAELYSHARLSGMAVQHDHNDVWIAATAYVTGLKLLSTDHAAFLPLRGTAWVDVAILNSKTGIIVP